MEKAVTELAHRIVERYKSLRDGERILVGVAGVPGSGKSTLAFPLTELINELLGFPASEHLNVDKEQGLVSPEGAKSNGFNAASQRTAISVSLDGWHTTRADLDKMPDPAEARRRRGAAFTFDADDYVAFVRSLRDPCIARDSSPGIAFRTFDHAKKDPEPGPFLIEPRHRIVVIEGLYVLLDTYPWRQAAQLLDERIWVECEPAIARSRLVARHLQTGIEPDREAAERRVDGSDMLNGEYIREHLVTPTSTVCSVLDMQYVKAVEEKMSSQ